jgi:hypothetical protein
MGGMVPPCCLAMLLPRLNVAFLEHTQSALALETPNTRRTVTCAHSVAREAGADLGMPTDNFSRGILKTLRKHSQHYSKPNTFPIIPAPGGSKNTTYSIIPATSGSNNNTFPIIHAPGGSQTITFSIIPAPGGSEATTQPPCARRDLASYLAPIYSDKSCIDVVHLSRSTHDYQSLFGNGCRGPSTIV